MYNILYARYNYIGFLIAAFPHHNAIAKMLFFAKAMRVQRTKVRALLIFAMERSTCVAAEII